MANPYASLLKGSKKLISKLGYTVTLRAIDGSFSYPIKIVMSSYDPRVVDGQIIQFLDKRAIAAGKDIPIVPDAENHQIVDGTLVHQIVSVKPTSPGGQAVIYEMQLRSQGAD